MAAQTEQAQNGISQEFFERDRLLPGIAEIDNHRMKSVVSLNFTSWNQLDGWLRQIEGLRRTA